MANKHGIVCRECGHEETVDYETAKLAEAGDLQCDPGICWGYMKRVWGSTGHIWIGRNGVDLSNPLAG